MSTDEFNRLCNELLAGLPITLVVSRILLALRGVVDAGGEPAADALRQMVALRGRSPSGPADGSAGPGEAPRKGP
jgi:hypothetical protein